MNNRIYLTGDLHGDFGRFSSFCEREKTTMNDVMICLGDSGLNYYASSNKRHRYKTRLARYPLTFIVIKGNHDRRPSLIKGIQSISGIDYCKSNSFEETFLSGLFYYDVEFPNILYTEEYGPYIIGYKHCFVIGGAYSIDKNYRLTMQALGYDNYYWFGNEQLTEEERNAASEIYNIAANSDTHPRLFLSHTAPKSLVPTDALMPNIDKRMEDWTMEEWMDTLDPSKTIPWYFGHFHVNATTGNGLGHCLFDKIVELKEDQA